MSGMNTRKPIHTADPHAPQVENPGCHLVIIEDTPMNRHWVATYSATPGVPPDAKLYLRPGGQNVVVFVTRDAPWVVAIHQWLVKRGVHATAILPGMGGQPGINLTVNS